MFTKLQLLYTDTRLVDLLDVLDQLHSAASEGYLETLTTLETPELLEMLREVVYTAQEAINEIEAEDGVQAAALRVLPKAAGGSSVTELHH
ncbi:MAG: hypothetical protein HXY40_09370 [Chloroflexi bacterium]|nr:hypothetical protein [Chloroflexota bacterium]